MFKRHSQRNTQHSYDKGRDTSCPINKNIYQCFDPLSENESISRNLSVFYVNFGAKFAQISDKENVN